MVGPVTKEETNAFGKYVAIVAWLGNRKNDNKKKIVEKGLVWRDYLVKEKLYSNNIFKV